MPRLWEKSFRSAPAGPNGLVWVNDVKVTGTPVVTWPSNWAEAMLWPRPSVKAVVEEEKLAYRLSEVRDVSTQVVVMTTGDEPTAEAPGARLNATAAGTADTVSDSPKAGRTKPTLERLCVRLVRGITETNTASSIMNVCLPCDLLIFSSWFGIEAVISTPQHSCR